MIVKTPAGTREEAAARRGQDHDRDRLGLRLREPFVPVRVFSEAAQNDAEGIPEACRFKE